jgi:hypothetical protein
MLARELRQAWQGFDGMATSVLRLTPRKDERQELIEAVQLIRGGLTKIQALINRL